MTCAGAVGRWDWESGMVSGLYVWLVFLSVPLRLKLKVVDNSLFFFCAPIHSNFMLVDFLLCIFKGTIIGG